MDESPFASTDDVADRWRTLTEAETRLANILIDDASDIIRSRWPDVDDRITSGALREQSLVRVVAGMVKRAMLVGDSEGVESRGQTAGPFGTNVTYANPAANLYLRNEDVLLLNGGKGGRAFAVDLSANVAPCGYDREPW
jgi:hypothetical protein